LAELERTRNSTNLEMWKQPCKALQELTMIFRCCSHNVCCISLSIRYVDKCIINARRA